jgi:hypothetical protein
MKSSLLLSSLALLVSSYPLATGCAKKDPGVVEIRGKKGDDDEEDAGTKKKPMRRAAAPADAGESGDDDATQDDDSGDDDVATDDDSADDDTVDDVADDDSGDDDVATDDDSADDDTADDDDVTADDDTSPSEPSPGAGGMTSGSGGTTGNPGSGGTPATGGSPVVVSGCGANVIDDFSTCDKWICPSDGREGVWFTFAGDGIGLDPDQEGVRYPTSDWSDESCAVMLAGGELEGETEFYAGVGLNLSDTNPYDLSGYTGVRFVIETGAFVDFTLRTAADEYFISTSPAGGTTTSEEFTIPFSTLVPRSDTLDANPIAELNLALVTELQWTVQMPEYGFGLAIHRVELY